jgi:uncharacterized phage protein gp47/JayE
MPFTRATLQELRTRVENDLVARLQLAAAVLRRSFVRILARAWAGIAHGLYGYIQFLSQQLLPDTSEGEYLERQASLYGLSRTAATFATGNVTLTGQDGTLIAAGTVLQRSDQLQYEIRADVTISSGTATAILDALVAGQIGNADAGVALSLVSPIAGVNSSALVAMGGLSLGNDQETDDDFRARVIERYRFRPHGGAEDDYIAWAKEVAGVTRVWVFPGELGAGKVSVRFVRDGDASIIPDGAEVAQVQAYIEARRPVTAQVTVVAPISTPLNFTISITPDTAAVRATVEAQLRALLGGDEVEPGGTVLLSRIRTEIGLANGLSDFTLSSPNANVTHTTGQLAVMGVITW